MCWAPSELGDPGTERPQRQRPADTSMLLRGPPDLRTRPTYETALNHITLPDPASNLQELRGTEELSELQHET